MIADQVVNEVKTALDNGVTDLKLLVNQSKWDAVDAAWGEREREREREREIYAAWGIIWQEDLERSRSKRATLPIYSMGSQQHTSTTGWQRLLL